MKNDYFDPYVDPTIEQLISNCPLCEERALHSTTSHEKSLNVQQCINCGYFTSNIYELPKEDNLHFQKLNDEMKEWSKVSDDRIWIPNLLTFPVGMVYPIGKDNLVTHKKEMKWAFAPMVTIPEEERKNYPLPPDEGGFHTKRIDTDNPIIFDEFMYALLHSSELQKKAANTTTSKLDLPKLNNGKKKNKS